MSDSLDTLPYYRFRLYSQQGGIISAHYSQPQTERHDDCGTTTGPVVLFPNAVDTWQALRGAEPHPFTQAEMDAAIKHMTPLWTCLPPEYSQKWELDISVCFPIWVSFTESTAQLDSNSKPVYFEVLDDDPGSCTHRRPSEPAKAVENQPRKFTYPSKTEAERHFGTLDLIEMAAKRGDRTATRYHLTGLSSKGEREHLATVAVSLSPNSLVPSGHQLPTRRICKISPWNPTETAVEDGTSQQEGFVGEDDWTLMESGAAKRVSLDRRWKERER